MRALFFLFTFLFATSAFAEGNAVGNGGGSIVCRDNAGKITRAELLDLYEAREVHGLKVNGSDTEFNVNAARDRMYDFRLRLQEIDEEYAALLVIEFNKFFATIQSRFVSRNNILPDTPDTFYRSLPKGCVYEQLANYFDGEPLLIADEIWNELSATDQIALYVHEAVYALERKYLGAVNSSHARKIVASLFGAGELTKDELWNRKKFAVGDADDIFMPGRFNYKTATQAYLRLTPLSPRAKLSVNWRLVRVADLFERTEGWSRYSSLRLEPGQLPRISEKPSLFGEALTTFACRTYDEGNSILLCRNTQLATVRSPVFVYEAAP